MPRKSIAKTRRQRTNLPPLKSDIEATRRQFVSILRAAKQEKHRGWYFGISLDSTNPNSLCSYLGLSQQEYDFFLQTIGLITWTEEKGTGNKIREVQNDAWVDFLFEFKLNNPNYGANDNDVFYFGIMKVGD